MDDLECYIGEEEERHERTDRETDSGAKAAVLQLNLFGEADPIRLHWPYGREWPRIRRSLERTFREVLQCLEAEDSIEVDL